MSDLDEFLNIVATDPHPPQEWCAKCNLEMHFTEDPDKYPKRTFRCMPCERYYVITLEEADMIERMKRDLKASREAQKTMKETEVGRRQR